MLFSILSLSNAFYLAIAVFAWYAIQWVMSSSAAEGKQGHESSEGSGSGTQSASSSSNRTHSADSTNAAHDAYDEEPEADEGGGAYSGHVRLPKQKVEGASGEILRILNSRDYYAVLEVARDAAATDIKKSYRLKQMATHPDKNQGLQGALQASQRVNAAYDTLGDEIRRKQYDMALLDEETYGPRNQRKGGEGASQSNMSEMAKAFDELVRSTMPPPPPGAFYPTIDPGAYDAYNESPTHTYRMPCECGYDHIATKVADRSMSKARYCCCSQCGVISGKWLPARHNDVWFETKAKFLGQIAPEKYITAYRCVGHYVYDITPFARCRGMMQDFDGNPVPTNVHYIFYRMSGGADGGPKKGKGGAQKQTADYGFNQFKGGGVNSHKSTNNKKKKKR